MSEHSVDVLTDGAWVPVGGVMRWRGTHMPKLKPIAPKQSSANPAGEGVCKCGAPTYSPHPTTRYCLDCQREARRLSWRNSGRRKTARKRGEVA